MALGSRVSMTATMGTEVHAPGGDPIGHLATPCFRQWDEQPGAMLTTC